MEAILTAALESAWRLRPSRGSRCTEGVKIEDFQRAVHKPEPEIRKKGGEREGRGQGAGGRGRDGPQGENMAKKQKEGSGCLVVWHRFESAPEGIAVSNLPNLKRLNYLKLRGVSLAAIAVPTGRTRYE